MNETEGGAKNFFTQKLGPLPVWAWAAIGIGLLLIYLYKSGAFSGLGSSGGGSAASGSGFDGSSGFGSIGNPNLGAIAQGSPGTAPGAVSNPAAGTTSLPIYQLRQTLPLPPNAPIGSGLNRGGVDWNAIVAPPPPDNGQPGVGGFGGNSNPSFWGGVGSFPSPGIGPAPGRPH